MTQKRFDIDTRGFMLQMMELKPFRIVQEIISNSFDEDSVSKISCEIKAASPRIIEIRIEDDGDGFIDISEAYTLFARSKKRNNPKKRGRFNLGEKQFFAIAKDGFIESGSTRIDFKEDTRTTTEIPKRKGVLIFGRMQWKSEEIVDILRTLGKLMVPEDKILEINNTKVKSRKSIRTIKNVILPTVAEGENYVLTRVDRPTEIILYKVEANEKPWLYELGIPVQELDMGVLWHLDVQQKIHMPPTRTNVSSSYLKKLHIHLVNNTYDLLNAEESVNKFVSNGLSGATKQSFDGIMLKRYGTTNISVESSVDYRANEKALESGAVFLRNGDLDGETRRHGEELGSIYYAGEKFQTKFTFGSGGTVKESDQTRFVRKVIQMVALDTIQTEIAVEFADEPDTDEVASLGMLGMRINLSKISLKEWNEFSARVVGVVIHELSHQKYGNNDGHAHFSHDYLHELQRIAGIVGKNGIQYWIDQAE